ncbi:chemotaxis protein CheW [Palleronia abyssalis]|uniref:Chemotaxis protein CheW n=1 Tax=Palleronia abyssalis TaxID=1501240 RepID=A0A2R8BTY3_9RHOB|nr:chemotaxis protein CheW [Palleronia abyssalis]SPJ23593.1 Chemotaxis protein CheW [Palleronia abyssalis]
MFDENSLNTFDDSSGLEQSTTYLTLDLGGQILGIEVCYVREILDEQPITKIPNAPMDVLGVVDVRGSSVPIVDLQSRLGMAHGESRDEARIIVLELMSEGETYPIGMQADRVHDVEQIPAELIEPVPSRGFGDFDFGTLKGLYRKNSNLVVLVDLEQLFSSPATEMLLA